VGDCLFQVIDLHDAGNRTKRFLNHDLHLVINIGQQGWLKIPAVASGR
jgi:hypothetical protein